MGEDEFARTERGVPVVFDDELAAAAGQPGAAQPKKEREVHGPAWAGTLPKVDAQGQPLPPQPAAMPMPAAAPAPDQEAAPTTLDQRVRYPMVSPPAPRRAPEVPAGSDLPLKIALGLIAAAIVLVGIGLLIVVLMS